ncbi:cobalt-precorrin-5B (C(1))-methyltransferase [[Phormidium ambiguum] IAM M-71]|uniref:Cobalt-precorrin-5B C(1)-methyltransferase n=1 Tax=[Phormidium ambiguum] IAM M-71 TaxID=454136 RepID=A0A1U7IFM0_9CYAN|nr:cobalt-precorrin-5B (C(1))-methyltransferase CbiD [Phormidium ambiguum]OKH35842.1 cobalt-precorrin-5B (C(1))-methyltransferase [Phormidium ambiguum IAM M-71]
MINDKPRSGYTLPVFAAASAIAALQWLKQRQPIPSVKVDLINPAETVEIAIEQVSGINDTTALAITRSDPGDNLDLTRNTPVWALVELSGGDGGQGGRGAGEQGGRGEEVPNSKLKTSPVPSPQSLITLKGGEGIGRILEAEGKAAIYAYARQLLEENLARLLAPGEKITVTIILPEGRQLADRTSNAAFGVVEGLSLLGTSGISQPLSASGQLDIFQEELREKIKQLNNSPLLVFCIGENGLNLAEKLGISPERLVKTANWLGPMLVEAGKQGVREILLFGYHGKLMKLAGGIFHTHHYFADGRQEILTAHCAKVGLPTPVLQRVFAESTADAALNYLRALDGENGSNWVEQVYESIAQAIDDRTQTYIYNQIQQQVRVGSILFDRQRQIIIKSKNGIQLFNQLC